MLIHKRSHRCILKGLMFHYVAPMTGRIPNADQQEFILLFSFFKGLIAPWIPIHRIMGVLEQVRAAFMDELIGIGMLHFIRGFAAAQAKQEGNKENSGVSGAQW